MLPYSLCLFSPTPLPTVHPPDNTLQTHPLHIKEVQPQLPQILPELLNPRMENWNQDLPERYSKFCGLYKKIRGHGKWPWTW